MLFRLIHEIADAAGLSGMVGGQALDLESEGRRVAASEVEAIHRYKTSALILAAVRVGAAIGGASPQELSRLSRYGRTLGVAFQIRDDILDAEGRDAGQKKEDGDRKKAKPTYPSVVGLDAARRRARDLVSDSLRQVKPFGVAAEPLRWIARYAVVRQS